MYRSYARYTSYSHKRGFLHCTSVKYPEAKSRMDSKSRWSAYFWILGRKKKKKKTVRNSLLCFGKIENNEFSLEIDSVLLVGLRA